VLAGGGEMGAAMRDVEWANTPVGPPEKWPQSLRTAVSILLESKFGMMIAWGREFTQFYNDTFRPILGETKHPAFGRSSRETFPEAWHIVGPLFEQVMQGQAFGFEDMLVPLDRSGYLEECYFHYSYGPIRDESGGVGGVHVVVNETTSRVLAERRLHTLRELASATGAAKSEAEVWAAAQAVLARDAHDIPFAFQYRVDTGAARARLVATPSSRLAPADVPLKRDEPGLWPLDPELLGEGVLLRDILGRFGHHPGGPWPEPVSEALVLPVTRPGLAVPFGFLVTGVSPRRAFDQRYRDFFVLIADQISAAVASARAFEQEQHRADLLAQLDRQKTAFFSNVSHEFRTPLTLILGPVDAALASRERALSGAELERVQRNARRLSKLVNTLLDFSRLEAGRAEARFEPVDASALTAALASNFVSVVESAGLSLSIRCPPLNEPVYLDPEMWEKVVLNLISNAFKFTFKGSIDVSLEAQGEHVVLAVSDTGTGIPESELPHVFERFRRVERARGRSHEGSGIGLALVREIVRMHGGEVEVESRLDAGSCFRVRIPRGKAHLPAQHLWPATPGEGRRQHSVHPFDGAWLDEARLNLPAAQVRGGAPPAAFPTAVARDAEAGYILIVDDNADMRDYSSRLLTANGWNVETAVDGEAALERVQQKLPLLVLSDVMMPRRSGVELLRALKERAETQRVPVILLSARAGDEATAQGLLEGADDYLTKPFSARELISRVAARIELARARSEATRARERLRAQFMQAPVAVAVVSGRDFVYELANPLYLEMIGRRDVLGKSVRQVFPELPRDAPLFAMLESVYASGKPFDASDYRLPIDRQGTGRPEDVFFKFTCQPVRNESGRVVEIMTVALDMTVEVEARRRVEALIVELQQADQRKDEFLATLAHELRNPMAAISTALSLLESPSVEPDAATRYREMARRQMNNLVRLVDDLLDVARITRGKIELRKESVDLAAVIEHAVQSTRAAIEARGHAISVQVAPTSTYRVHADATRLEQVVLNLLTNAAKYTERGGRLDVSLAAEDGARPGQRQAVLRVRDTGRGIPKSMLDKVFDLFTQVSPSIDRNTGGLGLGLTLVKHLTEMHDGSVSAHSDGPGRGSEFTIRLPLMAHTQNTKVPEPPASTEVGRHRILIVEDSEDVRELLVECLQSLGHEVFSAADGLQGADRFASVQPEIALVDVGLPGIDGYELARRIRAQPGGDKAHLVALTGYGGQEVKREAESAGFNLHLTKPVDIEGLMAVLAAYEEGRKSSI
jgi:signal transduction histidine kinase